MSARPWMPFYVNDFRVATLGMATDEIGVYTTMILLAWERGGPLPGDDDELRSILKCCFRDFHGNTYNRIVPKLLKKFFYRDENGDWRQKRVEKELKKAEKISEKQSETARKRWEKAAQKTDEALKTNGNADAGAMPLQSQSQPHNKTETPNLLEGGLGETTAHRKASRAKPRTSISEDQQPAERDCEAAKEAGLSGAAFREEWRKFRDYHRAKGSLMADWSAAWRTWLRNVKAFQARPPPRQRPLQLVAAI